MDDFVGRVKEIQDITNRLISRSNTSTVVIVYGLRAIGKSSIVRQICHRIQDFEVELVDLKNVGEGIKILEPLALSILKESLSLLGNEDIHEVFDGVVKRILTTLKNSQTKHLIVFDNMEDVMESELSVYMENVIYSLASLKNTRILATSTTKLPLAQHPNIFEMTLGPLSLKDSQDLLCKLCPFLEKNQTFYKIVDLCEGLPLVLQMTAAEIDAGDLTVEEITYLLSQCRLKLLSQEFYPSTERLAPVYLAFLHRMSKPLQEKLSYINYIPGTFDEKEALEMMGPENSNHEYLRRAVNRHVIQKYDFHKRFNIHGILRDCISEYMLIKDLPLVRGRFCRIFSKILQELENKSFTSDYQWALCQLNLEQQNFNKLLTDVFHCTSDTYQVFVNIASFQFNTTSPTFLFNSPDSYEMGMMFYKECLRLTQQHKNDYDSSKVLSGLGSVITNIKGDYILGERHYRNALRIRQNGPAVKDCSLAFLYQSLGWNLGCQGKSQEAIVFLEKALTIEIELGMHLENLILSTLQSLALFHLDLGHMDIGEKYQLEALRRRRQAIGTDMHPILGAMLNNVGEMYQKKGHNSQAEYYFRRGLEIKTQTNAAWKSIALSEVNVANLLTETGRPDEALEVLDRSMKRAGEFQNIYQDIRSLINECFGRAFMSKKMYKESVRHFREAVRRHGDSQSRDYGVLSLQCRLADCLICLGKHEEAIDLITSALRQKDAAIRHKPTTLTILSCYRILQNAQSAIGKFSDAHISHEQGCREYERLKDLFEGLCSEEGLEKVRTEWTNQR